MLSPDYCSFTQPSTVPKAAVISLVLHIATAPMASLPPIPRLEKATLRVPVVIFPVVRSTMAMCITFLGTSFITLPTTEAMPMAVTPFWTVATISCCAPVACWCLCCRFRRFLWLRFLGRDRILGCFLGLEHANGTHFVVARPTTSFHASTPAEGVLSASSIGALSHLIRASRRYMKRVDTSRCVRPLTSVFFVWPTRSALAAHVASR